MNTNTPPPSAAEKDNMTTAQVVGFVAWKSNAFSDCYFLIIKNTSAIPIADYFCEQWEIGQILGGN